MDHHLEITSQKRPWADTRNLLAFEDAAFLVSITYILCGKYPLISDSLSAWHWYTFMKLLFQLLGLTKTRDHWWLPVDCSGSPFSPWMSLKYWGFEFMGWSLSIYTPSQKSRITLNIPNLYHCFVCRCMFTCTATVLGICTESWLSIL